MGKFINSLKYIFSGKDEEKHFEGEESKKDPVTDVQLFIHQQAMKIQEHIEYEKDLAVNLPRESSLIIKFDIENYIKEYEDFFIRKDFYSLDSGMIFTILLQILVPPENTREIFPKEFRKQIFAGMLKCVSIYKAVSIRNLTKDYYERIHKSNSLESDEKRDILELFKDSMEILEKLAIPKKIAENRKEHDEDQFEVDTSSLLLSAVKTFSLKTKKDIENLLFRDRFWGMMFSVAVLFIIAVFCIFYTKKIITSIIGGVPNPPLITALTAAVTGLFIFIIMCRINGYTKTRVKRKYFLSTVNLLISELHINYTEVKSLFKKEFNFDIRRIPKLKKIAGKKKDDTA